MILTILSNRGGVGKSTVSGNLGIALSQHGKRTLVVEGDLGATSLHMVLGVTPSMDNFKDVLDGRAMVEDALIEGAYKNLNILPNKIKLKDLYDADLFKFVDIIFDVSKNYDYVIVDGPAGIGKNALVAMRMADELILVTNPNPQSISATLKLKKVAEALSVKIRGIVLNKVPPAIGKGIIKQVERYFELPLLATIPLEDKAEDCFRRKRPILTEYPTNRVSKEIEKIANSIITTSDISSA
ncbi:MAG: P-loop NTPase [Candidatus Hydrothermarchaeales archaeon]